MILLTPSNEPCLNPDVFTNFEWLKIMGGKISWDRVYSKYIHVSFFNLAYLYLNELKDEKLEVNVNQNTTLSFLLLPELTDLMLLTVCRSKRSRAFVTFNSAVWKHAWWFWLTFPSKVLLGQWWYVPKEKIELLLAFVTPGATNCTVIIKKKSPSLC